MKVNFRKLFSKYNGALAVLVTLAGVLRILHIDYSDFQGDEIKALFLPSPGQSTWEFLLEQRKGPFQFLITFLIKLIDPAYSNYLIDRILFALAGVLTVLFFYKLVRNMFGNRVALFSSMFLVTNGFFVAFSRIIQYQSFVVLFMVLTLFCFSVQKTKYIYLGFVFWILGVLSHYDAVFIIPVAFYFLWTWVRKEKQFDKPRLIRLLVLCLISVAAVSIFYLPFLTNLSDSTVSYWQGRITGDVSGKMSSSAYLFSVYQPIFVLKIYAILFALGVLLSVLTFVVLNTNLFLIKNRKALIAVATWFILGVIFMEALVYIPGTHIYVYLLPLFIILGFGVYFIQNLLSLLLGGKFGNLIFIIGCTAVFAFLYAQSYFIYVDNYNEYPWESKKFLIWTLPVPNSSYHLSLFGFPYYRNWRSISDYTKLNANIKAYSSNERRTISRYYIDLDKSVDKAGYYIHIKNPQSYDSESKEEKAIYWSSKYKPVYTITRHGDEIVSIFLMESGSYSEIIKKGF